MLLSGCLRPLGGSVGRENVGSPVVGRQGNKRHHLRLPAHAAQSRGIDGGQRLSHPRSQDLTDLTLKSMMVYAFSGQLSSGSRVCSFVVWFVNY